MHYTRFQRLISSPLGDLLAIADSQYLYQLCFSEEHHCQLAQGSSRIFDKLEQELEQYFTKQRLQFSVPYQLEGTVFQKQVWQQLAEIPQGLVTSYAQIAKKINKPTAYRAVANANGANPLVIIIPCHRVIQANGKLGGYSAGIERKSWLLAHEQVVLN